MSPSRSSFITLLCVAGLIGCYLGQVSSLPSSKAENDAANAKPSGSEDLLFGNDGSLFLAGKPCEDPLEELRSGAVPECEPTCKNQTPFCAKMFFSSLDFVPCFCKKPLVRDERTKRCIHPSECPK